MKVLTRSLRAHAKVAAWAAVCGYAAWVAHAEAAHTDPAPLPDDVVAKLTATVQGSRNAAVQSTQELLQAILHAVDAIQASAERRTGQKTAAPTAEVDKAFVQAQRQQLARLKTELIALGVPEDVRRLLRSRFDKLDGLLESVQTARDGAERARSARRLREAVQDWISIGAEPADAVVLPVPTFREIEPFAPLVPESAKELPAYAVMPPADEGRILLASADTLAALPPATPAEATSCGYVAATDLGSSQEEVNFNKYPEIKQLAEHLEFNPARIFEYVSNNIKFQPYFGSLKGAAGTLKSLSGNAHDQASLLIALLRASNIPTRYVYGMAEVQDAQPAGKDAKIARWFGVKDYRAAARLLTITRAGTAVVTGAGGAIVGYQFPHVWVEACVPYTAYRASRITNAGHRWIPLDPSFKDKTYQAGIQHNVTFDIGAFLSKRTNGPDSLPQEIYGESVETAIRSLPPRFAGNSIDEVPYSGEIVKRTYDILPATLPYKVARFLPWDTSVTSPDSAVMPESHRFTLTVRVRDAAGTVLLEYRFAMPETVLSRITLSFKGLTAADETTLNNWRNSANLTDADPACTVQVTPSLRIEGVELRAGTLGRNFCTANLKLEMGVRTTGQCGDAYCINQVNYTNIDARNYYALHAYAFQVSNQLLVERASRLIASVRATANPNTNQEETEGEFLHLVGLKYMRYMSDAAERISNLMGVYGQSGVHLGVVTARSKIGYVFDLPFAVNRTGFLIDVLGARFGALELDTGNKHWDAFVLAGRTGSIYESYIWQENAKLDAVSTARGLQFAQESGIGLVSATQANWATERPKLVPNYSAAQMGVFDGIINNDAGSLYVPTKPIQYENWRGLVYMAESQAKGYGSYAISGGYGGGYTVNNPVSYNYNPVLNTGYSFVAPPPPPIFTNIVDYSIPPAVVNSAINFGGSSQNTYSGDPVNMVTGNMYHNETDIDISTRGGMRFVLQRAYNSRKREDGPLGWGWTHSFNHYLLFKDDNYNEQQDAADTDGITSSVVWVDGTGSEKYIAVPGANPGGIPVNTVFQVPAGFFFTAQKDASPSYIVREKDGLTYTFYPVAGTINERAKLSKITDRNGNSLTLGYDPEGNLKYVIDDLNRGLSFTYVPGTNRLDNVSDWTGRVWKYGYQANGDLKAHWKPGVAWSAPPSVAYEYYGATDGLNLEHVMKRYRLPRGNAMEFEYYANGRVFRHSNSMGEAVSFSYNDFRRETIQINERGNERRFFFNKDGLLIKLIEENGGTREYAYDTGPARFNLLKSVDPRGNETSYQYDANGNQVKITAPSLASIERTNYNPFGAPGKIKDSRGNYSLLKYDVKGNLLQKLRLKSGFGASVDPATYGPLAAELAAWSVNAFDAFGNLTSARQVRDFAAQIANPANVTGPTVEYAYDVDRRYRTGVTRRGDKDGNGAVDVLDPPDTAVLIHDTLGRLKQGIDGAWERVSFDYDDADRVKSAQDATGAVRSYFYDANGNVERETLSALVSGQSTVVDSVIHEYDLSDRRIKTIASAGRTSVFQYDAAGNPITTTNPDGYSISVSYDELNHPVAAADAEGNRVVKDLDIDGRPLSVTDPNGVKIAYEYYDKSKDMRLKRVTQPASPGFAAGRAFEYDYDAGGNVIRTSVVPADNGAARVSLNSYDELNRPTRTVGPAVTDSVLGQVRAVTRHTYDALGRLVQVEAGRTDVSGTNALADVVTVQARYTWDDFGRKLKETDAAGKSWSFLYDTAGNVRQITDPNGKITTQIYEVGQRLKTRSNEAGTITYTRDALGRPVKITNTNPAYTQSFVYDAAQRLSQIRDSRGNKTLYYDYSPGGLLNTLRHSEGGETNYLYDPVGRLIGIWAPNYDYFAFGYDRGGRLSEKWSPNGIRTGYAYNDDGTLSSIASLAGGTERAKHAYAYDAYGNRKEHSETLFGTEVKYLYDYDELSRLTKARYVQNATETLIGQYRYDILGNRTRLTDAAGSYLNYVPDALNQLSRVELYNSAGVLQATMASFTYDANGNLKTKATAGISQSFTWNANDLLAAAVTQTTTTVNGVPTTTTNTEQYWYDHAGRRTVRMLNAGQILQHYLYNGEDIYEEYAGNFVAPVARYTQGPQTDDPLMVESAAGKFYYHADGLGSLSLLTNEAGTSGAWRRYDPWGRVIGGTGTLPQYGYSGREPDLSTGMMYYRARYYDVGVGRFISRDPVGVEGGLNVYAYVDNNPTNFTDPQGLIPQSVMSAGIAGLRPSYFDQISSELGVSRGPTVTWRPSPIAEYTPSASAVGQFALGFIPGYDLYRAASNPNASAVDWTVGVLGLLPGLGKGAAIGLKGAAVSLTAVTFKTEARVVSSVARAEMRGVDLQLKFMPQWNALQRADACAKCQALSNTNTFVTDVARSGTSASARYKRAGGEIPTGHDVDHRIDLQLGGGDILSNMWPLNSSVNRSLGPQIFHQIKDLPLGTRIGNVFISD